MTSAQRHVRFAVHRACAWNYVRMAGIAYRVASWSGIRPTMGSTVVTAR